MHDGLKISGDLNFTTVISWWKASLPYFLKSPALHIDLSDVSSSNSAGLALLIEWVKQAKRLNKPIAFDHIPAQLQSIMHVATIEKIIQNKV